MDLFRFPLILYVSSISINYFQSFLNYFHVFLARLCLANPRQCYIISFLYSKPLLL